MINVVTCAILTLTHPANPDIGLWGLSSDLFVSGLGRTDETSAHLKNTERQTVFVSGMEGLYTNIATQLPAVIDVLLKNPWNAILPKVCLNIICPLAAD